MLTINDLVRWRADRHPDLAALIDERGDRVTYRELHTRSIQAAQRWSTRGIGPGDVVAVLDTSSVAFFTTVFGLSRLGAVPALLNWRLTTAEISELFETVSPKAVAAGTGFTDRIGEGGPSIRVGLHDAPQGWSLDQDQAADGDLPPTPVPGDVFALAFSSGTTGRAKAVPWRHEALARSTLVDGAECLGMERGARQLMMAPTFHLAGMSNTLMGLAAGAEIHLRSGFDPHATLDDIERIGVRYLTAVPAMFRALTLAARDRPGRPDTSSVLEMTYGASPIGPELLQATMELFPTARLRQFYGMTEIAGALTTLTPEDHDPARPARMASAGKVNAGFEVRLVDPDGLEVADGQPGQILIRGSSVMSGYWNDQAANADAFIDGWFASGDIATRSDGYLTIMDRAKDMVVTGGENVYPAEVEAAIEAFAGVDDVAVIGVPDEAFGERVHAVVVPTAGTEVTLDALQAFCRERLAGFKLPRSLDLVNELPRNPTGKLLKGELRAPYWADAERKI